MCCTLCSFLDLDDPALASTSKFLDQTYFVLYKLVLAVYFIFWCLWWPLAEDILSAYKFATYWTFYIAAIYFIISTVTAYLPLDNRGSFGLPDSPERRDKRTATNLSTVHRATLWLQVFTWNVASLGSIVVLVIFWGFLFNGGALTSTDINAHILVFFIMVLDMFLVATEYKFWHFWATEALTVIYIIFNIAYFFLSTEDDTVIYSVLDWGDDTVGAVVFTVILFVILVPINALIFLGLFRLREMIASSQQNRTMGSSAGFVDLGRGLVAPTVTTGTSKV